MDRTSLEIGRRYATLSTDGPHSFITGSASPFPSILHPELLLNAFLSSESLSTAFLGFLVFCIPSIHCLCIPRIPCTVYCILRILAHCIPLILCIPHSAFLRFHVYCIHRILCLLHSSDSLTTILGFLVYCLPRIPCLLIPRIFCLLPSSDSLCTHSSDSLSTTFLGFFVYCIPRIPCLQHSSDSLSTAFLGFYVYCIPRIPCPLHSLDFLSIAFHVFLVCCIPRIPCLLHSSDYLSTMHSSESLSRIILINVEQCISEGRRDHKFPKHFPKNNLNIRIKTESVTDGAGITVNVWFLGQICANKCQSYTVASATTMTGSAFMQKLKVQCHEIFWLFYFMNRSHLGP